MKPDSEYLNRSLTVGINSYCLYNYFLTYFSKRFTALSFAFCNLSASSAVINDHCASNENIRRVENSNWFDGYNDTLYDFMFRTRFIGSFNSHKL